MDRPTPLSRRARTACLPFLLCARLLALSASGEDLIPRYNGGVLQVAAPHLHFIAGRQLQRLRNGASIPFDFQLTLSAESKGNALNRALERFVVSYDLWEEKFSVVRQRDRRTSSIRLTAAQAESWCLGNLSLPAPGLNLDRSLWVKLEVRTAETRDQPGPAGDGINLSTLIEIFSRPARGPVDHWAFETGPFRLSELKPADVRP
ncbi:MAG: hypothetical protein M3Z32_12075 [Acidobacteriota bacterium]|nr:hypothetical protein [Acidobacteriota bacterium]